MIAVLKTCAKRAQRHSRYPRGPPAGTPHAPRDMALRSPPNREAESAIGVLRTALGRCKSEEGRGESAIGVLKMCAKRARRHSHYPESHTAIGVAQSDREALKTDASASQNGRSTSTERPL